MWTNDGLKCMQSILLVSDKKNQKSFCQKGRLSATCSQSILGASQRLTMLIYRGFQHVEVTEEAM